MTDNKNNKSLLNVMKRDIHSIVRGLYAVIDTHYLSLPDAASVTELVLDAGCKLVQLRAKGAIKPPLPSPLIPLTPTFSHEGRGSKRGERELTTDAILTAAVAMRKAADSAGAVFIVNDSVDIAIASKADGVHIGQTDAAITDARRRLGSHAIIGVSTHNAQEAIEAEAAGADYISFGPIFPTRTKLDADRPKGLAALAELRCHVSLPIVAIGGITEANAPQVMRAGADAVAVISAILLAKDIRLKTEALVRAAGR